MTHEEIRQKLESSFRPYRCVAEIWDYNYRIRFRIYHKNNEPIITIPELIINTIKNQIELESLIQSYKAEIRTLGFDID